MALNTQMSNTARAAEAQALADLCDNGYIRIYDGTQAADANTAVGAQTLLAELRFAATAETSVTNGVITFAAITSDSSANASGTASWFRCLKSDGTTVLFDGSVGTSSANLIVPTTTITSGVAVAISSFTHTIPASGSGV